jgi:CelD/BcsL family acetyltransferase involved in cellulose biosynthesis
MYVYRVGFDPAYARFSPGIVNTLGAIEAADEEGVERVEFRGGGERYKRQLADHIEPLHQAIGMSGSTRGHVAATVRAAQIHVFLSLKRSERVRHLYVERLAPARRIIRRVRR